MQEFLDFVGMIIKSLSTAIQVPFQVFSSSLNVMAYMPSLIATASIVVLTFGIVKLIVGWI